MSAPEASVSVSAPDLRRSALFFTIAFVQALDNQLVPVLLPVLRTEMGGAPVGTFLTAYALICGAMPFLATILGKAERVRSLSVGALGILAVAAFAFAAIPDFPARIVCRAAAGGASGILSMTLLLAAARIEDARERAHQFTIINAGYLTALVLGVPLGAYFAKRSEVSAIYLAIGAFALLLAGLTAVGVRLAPRRAEPLRPTSLLRLFHNTQAALVLLATGIVGVAMAGPVGYLGSFLAKSRGFEVDAIGAVYLWAGVGPLLAMPVAGRTITRWTPHRVAIAGSVIIAAPIVLFPYLATSLATAAAVMLVCVFIETIRRAALQGSLAEVAAIEDLPRYLAIRGVIVQLGLAIGYALAEVQFANGGYAVVCRIAAVLSLIAAAVLIAAGAPRLQRASNGTAPDRRL
jgi:predicted MFS family arabinose efflux permease